MSNGGVCRTGIACNFVKCHFDCDKHGELSSTANKWMGRGYVCVFIATNYPYIMRDWPYYYIESGEVDSSIFLMFTLQILKSFFMSFRFQLIKLFKLNYYFGFKKVQVKIWLFSTILSQPIGQRLTSPLLAGRGLTLIWIICLCSVTLRTMFEHK